MVCHDRVVALVHKLELMFGSLMMHWLYVIQGAWNFHCKPMFLVGTNAGM